MFKTESEESTLRGAGEELSRYMEQEKAVQKLEGSVVSVLR